MGARQAGNLPLKNTLKAIARGPFMPDLSAKNGA
jgi:hypothetical protein